MDYAAREAKWERQGTGTEARSHWLSGEQHDSRAKQPLARINCRRPTHGGVNGTVTFNYEARTGI